MSNIREWEWTTDPERKGQAEFYRPCPESPEWITESVVVGLGGVSITDDSGRGDGPAASADVVLAAIFRQAGIVDDLRAVIGASDRDWVLNGAVERIRKAFGEALS